MVLIFKFIFLKVIIEIGALHIGVVIVAVETLIESQQTILIVDDDVDLASNLKDILEDEGYNIVVANNGESALLLCREGALNLVIADIKLPDISGVDLTTQIGAICPSAEVIIVTGYASIDTAIAAVRLRNVISYMTKPLEMRNVLTLVKQVMARQAAQESERKVEQLYRLLAENVVDVIWTADLDLNLTYVSPSVLQQLGYNQAEALKLSLGDIVPVDSLGVLKQTINKWISTAVSESHDAYYIGESQNIKKDGSRLWTESRIRFMQQTEYQPAYLLGVTRDISRRRRVMEELQESRNRLARAEEIAHLGNWELDIAAGQMVWSDEIFRIFGLPLRQANKTFEDFLAVVHPDDRKLVERSVEDATARTKPFNCDHRIVRSDGSIRFVHEQGVVTLNNKGEPLRMLSTVGDITERIQIEEELRLLSNRLVQIQEEERQNIAHELHDQVGQVLTVLKLNLDRAIQQCSPEVQKQLSSGVNNISELISIVRNLSLNLRPAMLDDLGLLPTLFWYFERYSTQTGIKVDFKHNNLDRRFSPEITLAAYRIIQEGLTNAARYSGVTEISVRAWGTSDLISITVEDKGMGFNPEAIDPRKSSGLHGIRERVRLLNGTMSIESNPGKGTVLVAELPIKEARQKGKNNDRNRNR